MKVIKYLIVSATLFLHSFLLIQAQSTEGTDFWITFGQILNFEMSPITVHVYETQIRIVGGNEATSGTIFFAGLGTYHNFNLNPYEIYNYTLDNVEKLAVYSNITGITNHSIRIFTTKSVSVYAYSRFQGFSDATNILPVTVLGTEYYAISYKVLSATDDAYGVVATQNNTLLYHNGIPVAVLNAGQVYYRRSSDLNGLTGSLVTSDKPIAFFALCIRISIPTSGPTDILFQQLAPVKTWDNTFFVPVTIPNNERVRIVASQSGTNIIQTGGTIMTDSGGQPSLNNLQAGQFVELEIAIENGGCFIEANYPVGVCSFMRSWGIQYPLGSASQTWVPGIRQTVSKVLMAPFVGLGLVSHYALIYTPTATRENTMVSIGGAIPVPLSGGSWVSNVASGMSFYNFQLTNLTAPYEFSNSNKLIVWGYALGTTNLPASYYYLAGSAVRDLDAAFYANDIHFQDLKESPFCAGLVEFSAEINGLHPIASERIKWFVDGAMEPGTLNQETWSKTFAPGEYEIKMWVRYENDETAEKTGTLIIESCNQSATFFANNVLHTELKDTTFCNKNVNFRTEVEGLHPTASDSIMWYINDVFETSQATWSKPFENGTYEIKLVVHYDNDTYATLIGTLKIQALWIKIRNVRY